MSPLEVSNWELLVDLAFAFILFLILIPLALVAVWVWEIRWSNAFRLSVLFFGAYAASMGA